MIKEIQYVGIKKIVSRVLRHPLLKDFGLEQAVQYVSDFIDIFGLAATLEEKEAENYLRLITIMINTRRIDFRILPR